MRCGLDGDPFSGPQLYYVIRLEAGERYRVVLSSDRAGYTNALYAFPATAGCDAGAVETACSSAPAGDPDNIWASARNAGMDFPWPRQLLRIRPAQSGDWIVVLDAPGGGSPVALTVERYSPAANSSCTGATPLSFVGGVATVKGNTLDGVDEHGAQLSCGGPQPLVGPQLYYRVPMTQGKGYHVMLRSPSNYLPALAIVDQSAACQPPAMDAQCAGIQPGGAMGTPFLEPLALSFAANSAFLSPAASTEAVIAVDGLHPSAAGPFELTVTEVDLATATTCAAAQATPLTGAHTEVTGHTGGGGVELAQTTCGGTQPLSGPFVFHRVALDAQSSYRLGFEATLASPVLAVFPAAAGCAGAAIESACASGGATGLIRRTSVGVTRWISFSPPTSGDYIFAVGSMEAGAAGPYGLQIDALPRAANDRCADAQLLTLTGGAATVSADTTAARLSALPLSCDSSTTLAGPTLFYRVPVSDQQAYRIKLNGFSGAHLAAFISGCAPQSANADCASLGTHGGLSSLVGDAALYVRPQTSGELRIAVGSEDARYTGPFTLTVEQLPPAANDRCSAPAPLTLTGGKVLVQGSTGGATDEPLGLTCGESDTLAGPQVYYSVALQGQTPYRVRLRTLPPHRARLSFYIFPQSKGCSAAAIQAACAQTGAFAPPVSWNATSTVVFTPPVTGSYVIAVDHAPPGGAWAGDFELRLEALAGTPPNDQCTSPATLSLQSGEVSLEGDNELAFQDLAAIKCGGGYAPKGPDLFYRLPVSKDQGYDIRFASAFHGTIYTFAEATGCASLAVDANCTRFASSSYNNGRHSFLTPGATGAWILAVAANDPDEKGLFELGVKSYAPPTNDHCDAALPIAVGATPVSVQGNTTGAANQFGFLISCRGDVVSAPGAQVYYRFSLQAGVRYAAEVTPEGWDSPVLYLFPADACDPNAISDYCFFNLATHQMGTDAGKPVWLEFTPESSGDYVLAVDSSKEASRGDYGPFVLTLTRL